MQLWNWEFRKSLNKYIYSDPLMLDEATEMITNSFKSKYSVISHDVDYGWNSVQITLESEDGFDSGTLKQLACIGVYQFLDKYRNMIVDKIGMDARYGLNCSLSSSEQASLMFDMIGYPGTNGCQKVVTINL